MQSFKAGTVSFVSAISMVRNMFDIYYDSNRGETDLHEFFIGTYPELLDHVSDLVMFGCNNIEFYSAED